MDGEQQVTLIDKSNLPHTYIGLPTSVVATNDSIYWTDNAESGQNSTQHAIYQANLDGNSPNVLLDVTTIPASHGQEQFEMEGLATDDRYLYWASRVQGSIYRANLTSQDAHILIDVNDIPFAPGTPQSITVNDHYIYWTKSETMYGYPGNANLGTIYRANLDGTNPEILIDGADIPVSSIGAKVQYLEGIVVDENYLYWADGTACIYLPGPGNKCYITGGGSIYRANLDGRHPQVLVDYGDMPRNSRGSDYHSPREIKVDNQHIYWTDIAQGAIYRANLDGSEPQILVDVAELPSVGTHRLRGLTLIPTPDLVLHGHHTVITAGDTADVGAVAVNDGTTTHSFTIHNQGTAVLTLTGNHPVSLIHANAFTVTQPASTTLQVGESTIFTLTFASQTLGQFTDTVTIVSNDYDENRFSFVISGTVNIPPNLAPIPHQNISETVRLTFTTQATDTLDDTLTFSLSNAPIGASINPNNGLFEWTPTPPQGPAQYTMTVQVHDLIGLTDQQAVQLDVAGPLTPNDPPVALNDGASTVEDQAVILNVLTNDQDPNDDPLILINATSLSGTVSISGTTVVYTPTLNFNGAAPLSYDVSDGVLSDTGYITVSISSVNDAPTISTIRNITATVGRTIPTITLTVDDVDSDLSSLNVTPTSDNQTFLPNSYLTVEGVGPTRTLIISPTTVTGTAQVTLTVSDGEQSANTVFSLLILPDDKLYLPLILAGSGS